MLTYACENNDLSFIDEYYSNAGGKFYFDEIYKNRHSLSIIYRLVCYQIKKQGKIIDCACGHGELILKLCEAGYDAYALDMN